MTLEVVVLAAGKGTRMRSELPKVLHRVAGRPLVEHVVRTAGHLAPCATHVIYGFGGEIVPATLKHLDVNWIRQAEQKGTGHAMQQALPHLGAGNIVLILYGDVPLTAAQTLTPLVDAATGGALALLTVALDDPTGYGRIVRDSSGRVTRIVEHKDATVAERAIREVNTGIMALPVARLAEWLGLLRNDNAQGEYYLTDIVGIAVRQGVAVHASRPAYTWEVMGVNSKAQLAELERVAQVNHARALMEQGVTVLDPARLDVRGEVTVGRDVVLDVNVVLEGRVVLGDGVRIGPNNFLRDVTVAAGTQVQPNCVIEEAVIGAECRIGPFARIRPGTKLADHAHVGNFVEIKNSDVGVGSKVNHLSYVGDTTVGRDVNIGAGTITCNYDGANKHRTVIGDRAFIGSDTQLVAPVTIGEGATIGAGSTITKDAPPGELTLSRAEQKTRPGWKRPVKKSNK